MYLGDFVDDQTIDFTFTTIASTGAPTQLAGTPALSVYKGNGTTESTAGITLTVDFDARTGLNHVRILTTDAFYAAGNDFSVVITTGTVGGVSVVGYRLATFSIENRSGLRPTVAGRTLDVSAGGEAGVDWANVGSQTTVVGLSGTTIKTATDVETDTADIQTRLPATLTSGRMVADVAGWNGTLVATPDTAGYPKVTIKDGTGVGEIDTASGRVQITEAQIDQVVDEVWDEARSGHTTSGTFGEYVPGNVTHWVGGAVATPARTGVPVVSANLIRGGTAQAGGASSITLDASAAANTDRYKHCWIWTTGGTGASQLRLITAYNGTSKVASVVPAWDTEPDNTTTWEITAGGLADVEAWMASAPNALQSGRVDSYLGAGAAGVITNTLIATDAIGSDEISAGAVTKIQTGLALATVCTEARLAELDAANLPTDIDQIKADLPQRITKNTALAGFTFLMIDSSDHVSSKTGLTVTATRSIDGAAFGACANAVTEVANGIYKIDLAAADLNGNVICLKFTATGADQRTITVITQP